MAQTVDTAISFRWTIICIGALLPWSQGCMDRMLLHPSTQAISAGAARQRLASVGGKTIELWVARSAAAADSGPRAIVLHFPGNASRAEGVAESMATLWGTRPVEIQVVNYPGFGQSSGPATLGAIAPAALTIYDELAAADRNRPIFVSGFSLGSAVALYVASQRPVAGVILQSPPPLQQMILEHGWWNLWIGAGVAAIQVPDELNALATAPRARAPAVFILTGQDGTVPFRDQKRVLEAYAGEKRLLVREDSGHNSHLVGDELTAVQGMLQWLWTRTLKPTTAGA